MGQSSSAGKKNCNRNYWLDSGTTIMLFPELFKSVYWNAASFGLDKAKATAVFRPKVLSNFGVM